MARINELINKSLRDSESYHERVKEFRTKIAKLESENNDKQNLLEGQRKQSESKIKELNRSISELNFTLEKTRRELSDSETDRQKTEARFK